mmetsp:Transcript_37625/g.82575  ORF Transcript_37625/g.82575 Transcript_37625/m.82575 type:complete len:201 (+) Transcript_37625:351-953(+)
MRHRRWQEEGALRLWVGERSGDLVQLRTNLLSQGCLAATSLLDEIVQHKEWHAKPRSQDGTELICSTARWPHDAKADRSQSAPGSEFTCYSSDVGGQAVSAPPSEGRQPNADARLSPEDGTGSAGAGGAGGPSVLPVAGGSRSCCSSSGWTSSRGRNRSRSRSSCRSSSSWTSTRSSGSRSRSSCSCSTSLVRSGSLKDV